MDNTTIIKCVIIDDEFLARLRIRNLLQKDENVSIVNEFDCISEAITFLQQHPVDLLYLDIHMPERNGFQLLKVLPDRKIPYIIFVTADEESALKAFEFNAIDYLLKPFQNERFQNALNKVKNCYEMNKKARLSDQFAQLMGKYNHMQQLPHAKENNHFEELIYIKSSGNYLELHYDKFNYELMRKTMKEIVMEVDSTFFIQIHRSIILNRYFIQQVRYIGNNEYEFLMEKGIRLKSSRSFRYQIEQLGLNTNTEKVIKELR